MKYLAYIKCGFKTLTSAFPIVKKLKNNNIRNNIVTLYVDLIYNRIVRGYDFDDYITFEFWRKKKKERLEYLSFRENTRIALKNTPHTVVELFLDKKKFNEKFSKFINREWRLLSDLSREGIIEFVGRNEAIILKPLDNYGGVGIKKINIIKDKIDEIVNELYKLSQLKEKSWLIEECIQNREEIKKLAPASLNTIRIVTVIDSNGKVHIPAALLRMGSGTSVMDNYHSGGMACPIDINSGTLISEATGEYNKKYFSHPYSKIKFEGYKIPGFKKILDIAHTIALVEPKAKYVGWDFALTQKGIEILEGNIPPGEHITQIASGPIRERLHQWL